MLAASGRPLRRLRTLLLHEHRQPDVHARSPDKTLLSISAGMRVALGVTAFATVYIGIMPEQFIRIVNWSIGLNPTSPIASLLK